MSELNRDIGAAVPAIIDSVSRGWNRDPAGVALGSARAGLSAAIWSHNVDDIQEVWAEPDPDRHIISVARCSGYNAEVFKNGRLGFSKTILADSVSLMQAGVSPRAVHRGRWEIMHLYLPAKLVTTLAVDEGLIASPGALELIDPECNRASPIARLSEQVASEIGAGALLSRVRSDTLGLELAIWMIRDWSNLRSPLSHKMLPRATGLAPWQVQQVRELMISDFREDRSLADLAAQVRLSPFHFARAFKASTGVPPHRYLVIARLGKVRELLEATDLPISDIAAQVGYDDPSYLARLFRREVGATPAEYRRERRR